MNAWAFPILGGARAPPKSTPMCASQIAARASSVESQEVSLRRQRGNGSAGKEVLKLAFEGHNIVWSQTNQDGRGILSIILKDSMYSL